MRDVHWLPDAEAYRRRAEELVRAGVLPVLLPVLLPEQAGRRRRWETVLRWHLDAAGPDSGVPAGTTDIVAALDSSALPAARVLGAATGRPVVFVRGEALPEADSLLLVGLPGSLTVRRVHVLNETVRCRWGVLTAADPAGLSFVVAKLLAARGARPGGARALIDRRELRTQEAFPDRDWGSFEPLDEDRVAHWLFERDWDVLGLDAHGEGAHINLGRVVGCGLVGGVERDAGGAPVFGCAEGDPPVCKRVTDPAQRVLHLRDLRARELFLVSCNGFAVAGDMYPSGASCVLSAADGYPASILTTDRLTAVDKWVAPLFMRLRERRSAGWVREFAGDLSRRLTGARPWILFGDPAGMDDPVPALEPSGTLPAGSVVPFTHDGSPGVLSVSDVDDVRIVVGERQGAVMAGPATGPIRIVDRSAELSRLTERMAVLARRVRRAVAVEHAARRLLDARHVEGAGDALAALRNARLRLELVATMGLRECADVRRRGVWNPVLVRQSEAAGLCVSAWDRACADLLAEYLFEGVEQVFADGWPVRRRSAGEPCARCATPSAVTVLEHPLGDEPDQLAITCPVCGPSTAHGVDGPRVSVEVPSRLTAGEPAELLVTTSDPRPEPLVDQGFLRCELVDKGRGKAFHRLSVPASAGARRFAVDMPAELRADLHTVRVVWVRGLAAASARARVPGERRDGGAAEARPVGVSGRARLPAH